MWGFEHEYLYGLCVTVVRDILLDLYFKVKKETLSNEIES